MRASALALVLTLAAGPVAAGCVVSKFAEFPVTISDMRALVSAKINGVDETFVVDSGAFYSVLTAARAAQLHLRLTSLPPGFYLQGLGGAQTVSLAKVKSFTLAGAEVPNVEFLVGITDPGEDSAGLIGQNVLGIADAEFDLANGVVRLAKPIDCGEHELAYWLTKDQPYGVVGIDAQSREGPRTNVVGSATVNGRKIKVGFDTGSPLSMLSLEAARRVGLGGGLVDAGFTGGIGHRPVRTWTAPVDSFEVGGEIIRHTRLRVGDMARVNVDMLLGADFFLSHRIYVARSQSKLYFTYNGGPVFNLDAALTPASSPVAAAPTPSAGAMVAVPTDAAAFASRGEAFRARRQYGQAVAELTRAIELAPKEESYLYQRSLAHLGAGQIGLAKADLDRAIELAPAEGGARLARAGVLFAANDKAAARKDLDAADKSLADQSDFRLALANAYMALDSQTSAIRQYDLWLAVRPDDNRKVAALNGRCWARATLGQDLDKALADCNAAIRLARDNAAVLDSRGLVRLRLGQLDAAIADYDQALKAQPKTAWSLYGRGLAKQRKGLSTEGKADIAAALAIDAKLAEKARTYGLLP